MKKIIKTVFAVLVIAVFSARAGDLIISDINCVNYPEIKTSFYVWNKEGKSTDIKDVQVMEDGAIRQVTWSCTLDKKPKVISSLLAIDCSASMASYNNLEKVKNAARLWIESLPGNNSECAISSFNSESDLISDFTKDKSVLNNSLDKLFPWNGTNFDNAFLQKSGGAMEIIEHAKYRKIIVFLTDGYSAVSSDLIISRAKEMNVTIYCLCVGENPAADLKNIAEKTGGKFFRGLISEDDIKNAYMSILMEALGIIPCEMGWKTDGCNRLRLLDISVNNSTMNYKGSYYVPSEYFPGLVVSPRASVQFGKVQKGVPLQKEITITCSNLPISIERFESDNPAFHVISYGGSNPPFKLNPGDSRDIVIEYVPATEDYILSIMKIIAGGCGSHTLYMSGGSYNGILNDPTIKLLSPNGGEKLSAGIDTLIAWTGVLPTDTVKLEYSTDAGLSWNLITDTATGLEYIWHVPHSPSKECLVRVSQLVPMHGRNVIILPGHTDNVTSIVWSPDRSMIATCSNDNTIKLWDPYSGENIRTLDLHESRISDIVWTHDGRQLISADQNGYIVSWNPVDGSVNKVFPKCQKIFTIDINNNDSLLAVYDSKEVVIKLFELKSGILVDAIGVGSKNDNRNKSVRFSHSSNLLAVNTGAWDRKILLYDVSDWRKIWELSTYSSNSDLNNICWSPDDKYIVATTTSGIINLINSVTGTVEKNMSFKYTQRNLAWSPDYKKIAGTGFFDSTVYIMGFFEDSVIKTLYLPDIHGYVENVSWSPDGAMLASCGYDSLGIIWVLEKPSGMNTDISDSLFEIIAPEPEMKTVDMGEVLLSTYRDSLVSDLIYNKYEVPMMIDSMRISGGDDSDFEILIGDNAFTVPPDTTRNIEFRFTPTALGLRTSVVHIWSAGADYTTHISGKGITPELKLLSGFIDFGIVEMSSRIDTVVNIIKNIGKSDVKITDARLTGPDMKQFLLESGGGAFILAPGEERAVKVSYKPENRGGASGNIGFFYDGPGSPLQAGLFGRTKDDTTRIILRVGEITAPTGSLVNLPIFLINPEVAQRKNVSKITCQLVFNSTLMVPYGKTGEGYLSGGSRYIPLELDVPDDTVNITWKYLFRITLGNAEGTDITLSDAMADNITDSLAIIPGRLNISNICKEGGSRLMIDNGGISQISLNPNPAGAEGRMNYNVIEKGQVNIELYDIYGRHLSTLAAGYYEPGVYTKTIKLGEYPQGNYIIVLRTETQTKSLIVNIIR